MLPWQRCPRFAINLQQLILPAVPTSIGETEFGAKGLISSHAVLYVRRAPLAERLLASPALQEKRKRDLGMQKGGKGNFVEEEKRLARAAGVYSNFD